MQTLPTWRGRSKFSYEGAVSTGTRIHYGSKWQAWVSREDYAALTGHFHGKTVKMGTSRTDPQEGSVGEWLQEHVTPVAIASYVGPILLAEGYAERVPGDLTQIRIIKTID